MQILRKYLHITASFWDEAGWIMYVEKDAKIISLISSLSGFITMIFLYVLAFKSISSNQNFELIQLMIFCFSLFFLFVLILSVISLIRDKKLREKHLENIRLSKKLQNQKSDDFDDKIKIPYNKWGLISLIISSSIGVIVFLYIYSFFANAKRNISDDVHIDPASIEVGSQMIFIFLTLLMVVLIFSVFSLIKKIQNPVFYEYFPCPVCGSKEIHRVEYSLIGGLLASAVHMARCKKCGKVYNGATGENMNKYYGVAMIFVIFIVILQVIRFLL